jgi:hypothetical protein
MNLRLILGLGVLSCLVGFNWNSQALAQAPAAASGAGATDGTPCTVTSGPNAGKKGTYTEGGTWCEGDWGGTECSGSKCKSASLSVLSSTELGMLEGYISATAPTAKPGALKLWEAKFNARVISKSGGKVTIAFANKRLTIDGNMPTLLKNRQSKL